MEVAKTLKNCYIIVMLEMKAYYPKSDSTLVAVQEKTEQTCALPMIDLQFGGGCNFRCIYCDTPNYDTPNNLDVEAISRIMKSGNTDFLFICGLGEPSAQETGNMDKFKYLLGVAKENGVHVSAFSNLYNWDNEIFDHVDAGTLNVLHKLDSFNIDRIKYLYGLEKVHGRNADKVARKYLNNVEVLKEIAMNKHNDQTNVGASIVLTNVNLDEREKLLGHGGGEYFQIIWRA